MDQVQQPPTTPGSRPRAHSRGISFASNRSGGSEGSKQRSVESPADKARRDSFWKGASKANPNAAINEQQPGEASVREESTLANLREVSHKDAYGNQITDPDLSNPTRPRLERPLDTIRSFEKAIDEGYKRRSSYKQEQSSEQYDQNNQYASRRSSYFGGYDNGPSPNRHAQQQPGGYYGQSPRTRYGNNRGQSDPQFYNQQRPYPQHNYHQSHDTVNTGMTNGSDSTGPWGNSTDPSSENSSLDRINAPNRSPGENYGNYNQNGYNGPIMEEQGAGAGAYGDYPYQNGYQNGHPQQQQQQGGYPRENYRRHNTMPYDRDPMRRPNPMQMGPPPPSKLPPAGKPEQEKRKSWISRKLSRKNSSNS